MTTHHVTVSGLSRLSHPQQVRASGVLMGTAVADAVGAPFEFQPGGLYAERFPTPVIGGIGEMIGGGGFGWAPGEFTDDTQMAIALANALEEADGFAPDVVWRHFRTWAATAKDVGITISQSLRAVTHEGAAEAAHEALYGRTASNGAVMRIAPIGIYGVRLSRIEAMELAMAQASLTHFDPSAAFGAAFVADIVRSTIITGDFLSSVDSAFAFFAESPYASFLDNEFADVLSPDFDPEVDDVLPNGTVWTAVGQAVWAVRSTASFHDAIVAAINLGGDTDTVAAIAGAMAGAFYGLQGIPVRWTTYVHGSLDTPHAGKVTYKGQDLVNISRRLLNLGDAPITPPEPSFAPQMVHPSGVWAANLDGAASVSPDFGVVSLCITEDRFENHPHRRQVYMRDNEGDRNPNLFFAVKESVDAINAFLREGRQVVVHCHGGRSRTGFVLKAWYMLNEGVQHDAAHQWMNDTWPLYETWTQTFFDLLDNEWGDYVEANTGGRK